MMYICVYFSDGRMYSSFSLTWIFGSLDMFLWDDECFCCSSVLRASLLILLIRHSNLPNEMVFIVKHEYHTSTINTFYMYIKLEKY